MTRGGCIKQRPQRDFAAVVIGASAGGFEAFGALLSPLPDSFPLPLFIAQHLHAADEGNFARHLNGITALSVRVPCDKENIRPGCIYVAPANYHMLIESNGSIALSVDPKIKWSRPSIDLLFESAAHAWGKRVIAVILTGANDDGAVGIKTIRQAGGETLAQTPTTAEYPAMPQAAIDTGGVQKTLDLAQITEILITEATHSHLPQKTERGGQWPGLL